ncbi:hypothetical protein H5410_028773 [Solanum commersonii]|uniref:Uncharacterized protein n=1 Tax=Solanum commersonii TaxID=4109 RepID=A0A9J5Z331_SOLCO|nr:hypothetical protein H5410_028773 [Solanum commersonii]
MSSRDMSMDTIMEDDESFVSNTNATIYGASYVSGRSESLISGPNIPNSSSTSEDDCHQQQISTAGGGDTSDDLIISSSASSNWFTNNKHGEVRIFNVDFRALSQNQFAQAETSSIRMLRSDDYSNVELYSARYQKQSMLNRSIAFSRKLYHIMVPQQIRVNKFRFDLSASIIYPTPIKPWIFSWRFPIQMSINRSLSKNYEENQIMNRSNQQRSFSSYRFRWTSFLHQRFVHAVELLGGHERANPRSILELMDIKYLKLIHVKSHLQMYQAFRNEGAKRALINR